MPHCRRHHSAAGPPNLLARPERRRRSLERGHARKRADMTDSARRGSREPFGPFTPGTVEDHRKNRVVVRKKNILVSKVLKHDVCSQRTSSALPIASVCAHVCVRVGGLAQFSSCHVEL